MLVVDCSINASNRFAINPHVRSIYHDTVHDKAPSVNNYAPLQQIASCLVLVQINLIIRWWWWSLWLRWSRFSEAEGIVEDICWRCPTVGLTLKSLNSKQTPQPFSHAAPFSKPVSWILQCMYPSPQRVTCLLQKYKMLWMERSGAMGNEVFRFRAQCINWFRNRNYNFIITSPSLSHSRPSWQGVTWGGNQLLFLAVQVNR